MDGADRQPVLSVPELEAFLDEVFPQVEGQMTIDRVGPMTATMTLKVTDQHLRPGGTVSGPSMFMLADCAFYVAVLGMIGREALTVTNALTINFLRKPAARDMQGHARILKLGRLLAVGDITLEQDGRTVAHATASYAIPPKGAGG